MDEKFFFFEVFSNSPSAGVSGITCSSLDFFVLLSFVISFSNEALFFFLSSASKRAFSLATLSLSVKLPEISLSVGSLIFLEVTELVLVLIFGALGFLVFEIFPLFDSTTTVETLDPPLLLAPIVLLDDLVLLLRDSVFSFLSFLVSSGISFSSIIKIKD